MTPNKLVDIIRLINFQTTEQYKTLMIMGPANSGKTQFAKLLALKLRAKYLDMLELFVDSEDLSKSIETLEVSRLKKYLLALRVEESIIIIDNMDFIVNTWSEREKGEFLNLVDKLRSNETKKTFVFFLQEDDIFVSKRFLNSRKENRILLLDQIADIKEISQ